MARRQNRTREIAAELRASIQAGDYPPGIALPSRAELIERYHVAPMTVRNAVEVLRAEGLVELKRGSGVYVRAQRPMLRSARNRLSRAERAAARGAFTTDAHTGGWTPRSEVTVRTEPATEALAEQLDVDPGEELLVRDRIMSAGYEVVQLATSYLLAAITTPEMHEQESGPGGIYARLEEAGHKLDHFEETVRIGQADVEEAEAFGVATGTAVFRLTRRAFTSERVVEVNDITMLGDRFTLAYELAAQ
ncbi:GntR family transcriptional regulator [Pseudonocardia parietis]|uniref:GntR family transcriptional regulator n=1 Tax=Pseudonocardia parietis TaxID=570936 RepID=A0ABS4W5A3_9PSEU|nr:GntR family transcriptional regulator [Pseudonocardia parietis]MBP2371401.1 GntR family transcriptional regulator [Pseudonocardia parietis]